jgi:uncharacterized membrane protein YfcA
MLTLIFIVGLSVGLLSTVVGMGGGILMVPALTAIAGLPQIEAMATSLATIALVSSWNTWRYHRQDLVRWHIVIWVAMGSGICAAIAGFIAPNLPEKVLVGLLILVLLILAWKTFRIGTINATENTDKKNRHIQALGIGSLGGLIAGFTGIGGGGITTSLMLVTGITKNRTTVPTSNAIMIFTTAAGAISFALNGSCDWPRLGLIHADYSLLLATGAVISSFIGIRINHMIQLKTRKTILGFILLFIALRLIFQLATS